MVEPLRDLCELCGGLSPSRLCPKLYLSIEACQGPKTLNLLLSIWNCVSLNFSHIKIYFRSLQASLWPQEAYLWPFGQFLAIKWAKMAGSKVCLFGSRPSSTQRTTYIHWFSRKDNFEIPPPLNTLCKTIAEEN